MHTRNVADIIKENKTLNPYLLIDPDVPEDKKAHMVFIIKNDFNNEITTINWPQTIKTMNQLAIQKLIHPAIGELTEDGGKYHINSPQLNVLKDAEFTLNPDGRMSIVRLDKNKSYCKYYAPGAQKHGLFEKEMRFLAKIIDLDFANEGDLHQEIIFTEHCSQQLKAKGLHFNGAFLKQLVLPQKPIKQIRSPRLFSKPEFDLADIMNDTDDYRSTHCIIL